MDNSTQSSSSCYGNETEAALLSAIHEARERFDAAPPAEKESARAAYCAALNALSDHLCRKSSLLAMAIIRRVRGR